MEVCRVFVAGKILLVFLTVIFGFAECRNFTIDYANNTFAKDGIPFRYVSGSIHYQRIHPDYWQDRLMKIRASGLNAIQTYVPWNVHEVAPDQYNFTGWSDLPRFLSLANEQGLVVLLRLGPYICGEWEFGGFPAWLPTLKKNMILRSSDPTYLDRVDKWFTVLLTTVKPFLYENGGPVVMVQIENEYGSYFTCDSNYMHFLYNKVRLILGNNIVVYTTDGDGDGYLKCGTIKEAYATVDFGITFNPENAFKPQRDHEPKGPLVNSEFYTGWLDHWGSSHSTTKITDVAKSLDMLLNYGANVNMYMFEGGTNFGFMNGANGPSLQPVPTSYDYDAPLNESGDATEKFYAVRDIVSKYLVLPPGPVPPDTLKGNYGQTNMVFVSTIQDALSTLCPEGPINSIYPLSMEEVQHYYGFILYRYKLKTSVQNGLLETDGVRDRGYVMVDQLPMGILNRNIVTKVNVTGSPLQYLDILVENQGRIGYSSSINNNTKGIISNVTLNGEVLTGWEIYPIHFEYIVAVSKSLLRSRPKVSGNLKTPSIYKGKINIIDAPDEPRDTFLDMRPWVKGQAFVNNFNLGRYWPLEGPQVTLYVPAPELKKAGDNELFLFELENSPCDNSDSCSVTFTDTPYINAPPHPKKTFKQ
ncbi:beta-galactosidase-like [Pomacea canaliculata]|uniref:beta-galactosidase-like n=1 Tax=Pomacea canaliculata TaxID=400727 RepID=UPI000D734333|nr:beta-galactosidase-like [Pomacea canaliculata]